MLFLMSTLFAGGQTLQPPYHDVETQPQNGYCVYHYGTYAPAFYGENCAIGSTSTGEAAQFAAIFHSSWFVPTGMDAWVYFDTQNDEEYGSGVTCSPNSINGCTFVLSMEIYAYGSLYSTGEAVSQFEIKFYYAKYAYSPACSCWQFSGTGDYSILLCWGIKNPCYFDDVQFNDNVNVAGGTWYLVGGGLYSHTSTPVNGPEAVVNFTSPTGQYTAFVASIDASLKL